MGWSHPDISLEDLLGLIKGFVDIIILASGYQSSGLVAVWDAQNIKKALQWGIFFENVFSRLSNTDDYQDSVKELDAALLELTSNPYFPQGLAHLSSATLTKARGFVLGHFIQTPQPLNDAYLRELLTALIEMDLDGLTRTEYDCLNPYIDKLMLQKKPLSLIAGKRGAIKGSVTSFLSADFVTADQAIHESVCKSKDSIMDAGSPTMISNIKTNKHTSDDHSCIIIQELLMRQTLMSCVSTTEKSLDILTEIMTRNSRARFDDNKSEDQSLNSTTSVNEKLMGLVLWNQWRSRSLSYLLDKRTIRMVSGAKLIFSSPKAQWVQVFESLKVSTEAHNDNILEIIELSLLGSISSSWSCLIEHFMSVSHDILPISKQYYDLYNLLQGRSALLHSKDQTINPKVNDILEYLMVLMGPRVHLLWKLPPVLAAAAIPSWSTLFRLYLSEMERQIKGDYSRVRCCTCSQEEKDHKDCEVAERISCLYVFHIRVTHQIVP